MWVKQCNKPSPSHHHFYRCGISSIPAHRWFMALFDPQYTACFSCHLHLQPRHLAAVPAEEQTFEDEAKRIRGRTAAKGRMLLSISSRCFSCWPFDGLSMLLQLQNLDRSCWKSFAIAETIRIEDPTSPIIPKWVCLKINTTSPTRWCVVFSHTLSFLYDGYQSGF